jgi:hypothetical protein
LSESTGEGAVGFLDAGALFGFDDFPGAGHFRAGT